MVRVRVGAERLLFEQLRCFSELRHLSRKICTSCTPEAPVSTCGQKQLRFVGTCELLASDSDIDTKHAYKVYTCMYIHTYISCTDGRNCQIHPSPALAESQVNGCLLRRFTTIVTTIANSTKPCNGRLVKAPNSTHLSSARRQPPLTTAMAPKAIVFLADRGQDPTETSVPWSILKAAGCTISFVHADQTLLAPHSIRKSLRRMAASPEHQTPLSWSSARCLRYSRLQQATISAPAALFIRFAHARADRRDDRIDNRHHSPARRPRQADPAIPRVTNAAQAPCAAFAHHQARPCPPQKVLGAVCCCSPLQSAPITRACLPSMPCRQRRCPDGWRLPPGLPVRSSS